VANVDLVFEETSSDVAGHPNTSTSNHHQHSIASSLRSSERKDWLRTVEASFSKRGRNVA
jgi:hypothetical protein